MGLSRTTKISILLGITGSFFVVELVVGYVVGSLALIADAYHMLNDAISLGIALYAIRLSKRTANVRYTYGWHRAEVIAALTNGVFLLALCFSILMESFERFAHPPEIDNPRLVVIVGAVGLGCNLFGLALFHDHGHDHGHNHGHGHGHGDKPASVHNHSEHAEADIENTVPIRRSDSIHSIYGLPAQNRAAIKQVAQEYYQQSRPGPSNELDVQERGENDIALDDHFMSPTTIKSHSTKNDKHAHHDAPSDGSLNIRGVLLHVAGDALGSIGVVVSGLIIWFVESPGRFYADPALSVAITILIMCSAIPLVRSAGFILLQGVPSFISLSDVRAGIADVPGVDSVHELHVWQLSEARLIASVHIKVSPTRSYMDIVRDVKSVFHRHGIHSGTVQPEFADDGSDTKCEITCPPNTCSTKEACCPLPAIKED